MSVGVSSNFVDTIKIYIRVSTKLHDTPTLIHYRGLKINKINIFLRPEEATFENW